MLSVGDRVDKFPSDFLVWNVDFFVFPVKCQISEMDQERQDVVPALYTGHIVLKGQCIDRHAGTAKQLQNILLKPVKIHFYVGLQCFVRLAYRPVEADGSALDSLHHRVGVIDSVQSAERISIVAFLFLPPQIRFCSVMHLFAIRMLLKKIITYPLEKYSVGPEKKVETNRKAISVCQVFR